MPSSIRATLAALWLWLAASGAIGPLPARGGPPSPVNIYVTLWFDEEDYILPQDDDATKRLAEMLTRLGIRATFKIVGEKARVLEQRGRKDVIAALQPHEIGYHSNTHSQQPTPAVYLQHAGWLEGTAEFLRREGQGAKDVARITGHPPVAYGQPGSSWGPQSYPALRAMGIHLYLDEADHVGIDDQPFYYGGHAQRVQDALHAGAHGSHRRQQPRGRQGHLYQSRRHRPRARRRNDQHLLPPERVGPRRVLGRGELQSRRQSAAQ